MTSVVLCASFPCKKTASQHVPHAAITERGFLEEQHSCYLALSSTVFLFFTPHVFLHADVFGVFRGCDLLWYYL